MIANANRIMEDYHKSLTAKKEKVIKVLKIILALLILSSIILFLLGKENEVIIIAFYIVLGITILFLITFLLVRSLPFSNLRLLYEELYQNIIKDINYNEDIIIDYKPMSKIKDYIVAGGLFTKYATVTNKYQMNFLNKEGYEVSINDTTVITSSDKSTTIHFDGSYYVFKMDNRNIFQLRTNSSPKLSKVKFNKINTSDDIKEYVKEDGKQSIETRFYTLFDVLRQKFPKQKIYICGVEKEIHVAIWIEGKRAKYPVISKSDLEVIRKELLDKVMLSEEIHSIISQ